MTLCPEYKNTMKAEFGRTITASSANEQFDAIESAMQCLQSHVIGSQRTKNNRYIHGIVTVSLHIIPSLGNIQLMLLEGDVELTIGIPESDDPRIIMLLLGDAGSGRFNFPAGAVWVSDSEGTSMDGKPWDNDGLGGDYGAVVWMIYDGTGWIILCFSRNDVDTDGSSDVLDLPNWR